MIPGSNLLNMASTVIAQQTVTYYQATGRTINSIGQYDTSYAAGAPVVGSFQPIDSKLYTQYGLDLSRTYYTLYSSNNIITVNRDVSGDQLEFNGRRFQCESSVDWFAIDGWKGVLCVLIVEDPSTSTKGH